MSRITRCEWQQRRPTIRWRSTRGSSMFRIIGSSCARRLHIEALEDRLVLATFTVTTNLDVVDASDGVLSLREAIADANAAADADTIETSPSVERQSLNRRNRGFDEPGGDPARVAEIC